MATYCNVCRICLSVCGEFMNIFEFAPAIMECAPINIVQGDGFPSVICELCLDKLQAAQHFRVLCIQSDIILRQSDGEITIGIPENNEQDFEMESLNSNDEHEEICNVNEKPDFVHFMTVDVQIGSDDDSNQILLDEYSSTSQARCDSIIEESPAEILSNTQQYNLTSHQTEENSHGITNNCEQYNKSKDLTVLKVIPNPEVERKKPLYKCKKCGKKFSRICYFRRHRRTHLKQHHLRCETCLKIFNDHQCLIDHKNTQCTDGHHCQVCFKTFTTKNALWTHLKLHKSKFKCTRDSKGKTVKNPLQLIQHKKQQKKVKNLLRQFKKADQS